MSPSNAATAPPAAAPPPASTGVSVATPVPTATPATPALAGTGLAGWTSVCAFDRLIPDRGAAALVDGRAVAVFRLSDDELFAVDNVDPCSGASVISRGLVGESAGRTTVASPMYKHRYDLHTGDCLDSPGVILAVHDVVVAAGVVHVRLVGP